MMSKIEYLEQARLLTKKITIKVERYEELKSLAEKATKVLTGMPRGGNSKTDDTIARLVDMANDINKEITKLTELQQEISQAIKKVGGVGSMVLELYYLCSNDWQTVADTLGYDIRHIYRLHDKAVEVFEIPKENEYV